MSGTGTDLDKALSALRHLRTTCSAAIDVLQQQSQTAFLASRPPCSTLHKDYQSLLTLIYTSTTKVTLVLRPSAPAPSAALTPIKDLGASITSLRTCATLFDLHGATLAAEARGLARDVCEAVRALADMFVESAGEDYLVRTGAVHDRIERARQDLSSDNLVAVKKRWKADREMMADSLEDINSMVEDAGQEDDLDGEEIDEEWDELGFGPSKKMSDVELERTKKVQPLVRFVTLFHKRVVPDVLGPLSASTTDPDTLNSALDALPSLSNAVVLSLEEVVASLYAPQKPPSLAAAVSTLTESIRAIHRSITSDILSAPKSDLTEAMSTLTVDDGKAAKPLKDSRKWFDSCVAQIDKSARVVDKMLTTQIGNMT